MIALIITFQSKGCCRRIIRFTALGKVIATKCVDEDERRNKTKHFCQFGLQPVQNSR